MGGGTGIAPAALPTLPAPDVGFVRVQTNAVCGSMLPQPRLRFLLADEPGTGKTRAVHRRVSPVDRL